MNYTLDNGRTITIPDAEVKKLQSGLGISKNEAIYTWLCDNDFISDETVEQLTENAKKNRISATIHGAKAVNPEKKERKPRERKENLTKKQIIAAIREGLDTYMPGISRLEVTNDEKYIEIDVDGKKFTVNLVQHRAKKT